MTHTVLDETVNKQQPVSRRGLSRTIGAGLAASIAGGSVLLSPSQAEAVTVHKKKRKHHKHHHKNRVFHTCEVHTDHSCWHALTCPHSLHHIDNTNNNNDDDNGGGKTDNGGGGGTDTQPSSTGTVPTAWELLVLNRFSYGYTPALYNQVQAAGSPYAWFTQQLNPSAIDDSTTDATTTWWDSLSLDAATIWQRDQNNTESAWIAMANYARWCLVRRLTSNRQLLEIMTEFWENLLYIPVHDDGVFGYRTQYGNLIKTHALGRFDEMLKEAIIHPAMSISLDNARSTKTAPNENLGRELLELFTVGRGNYTEDDVKASAKILTGYRVDTWTTSWKAYYDTNSHYTGVVKVMGFSDSNSNPDGQTVTAAYLNYLAHHPATASRIARKLAVRFVSDTPSDALVSNLADVYLQNNTAIAPVLQTLINHPEFQQSAGMKVKTPTDDVISTYRALNINVKKPTNDQSAANTMLWQTSDLGQMPFDWPRPDGPPQDNQSWSSVSRVLSSLNFHYQASGGWWPNTDVVYRSPSSWLPSTSIRFDALVDYLCVQILGKNAPSRIIDAASTLTGTGKTENITTSHALIKWKMPLLLTSILDTPDHMHR